MHGYQVQEPFSNVGFDGVVPGWVKPQYVSLLFTSFPSPSPVLRSIVVVTGFQAVIVRRVGLVGLAVLGGQCAALPGFGL